MTKKQLIDKYEEQIKHLKSQNNHMYVCETNSLHQSNGELYVEHENGLLVFDILNLFKFRTFLYGTCRILSNLG